MLTVPPPISYGQGAFKHATEIYTQGKPTMSLKPSGPIVFK